MIPPKTPLPAPTGDVMPYPGSALNLGAGKWLTMTGKLVTSPTGPRGSRRVNLTAETVKYWEKVALKGQNKPLSELIV